MSGKKTAIVLFGIYAATLLLCLVLETLNLAGSFRSIEPHFMGRCERVSGIVGAEDMVFDEEAGLVFMSNDDRRATEAGEPVQGGIFAFDVNWTGHPRALETDFQGAFHPHGLSFYRPEPVEGQPAAKARLFVVNHPTADESTVEIFELDEGPRLRHVETMSGPEMVSANDVAATGPTEFYFTNDAGTRPHDAMRVAETYLRIPWANVVYFNGRAFSEVVGGLRYANGIILSRDGTRVYVAESTGRALHVFDREPETGTLVPRARLVLPGALDNIAEAEDGALWIAAHPRMLAFVAHAKDPAELSPSQVFRVTVDETYRMEAVEVLLDDGTGLSGASVALPLGDRFLVGSVFERHFADCRRLTSNAW